MVALDEDALICDFAETYGVFDYRSLPVKLAATFAVGLRDTSRIKTKLNGLERPLDEYLLAAIYDVVNWIRWSKTKDVENGSNMPGRILDIFFGNTDDQTGVDEYELYDSPEAYEQARNELIGDTNDG